MKRQIVNRALRRSLAVVCGMGLMALSACSSPEGAQGGADKVAGDRTTGWTATPHIETVASKDGALVFHGLASPGARVVLRTSGGQAFAVSADGQGVFDLSMPPPAGDLMLTPEVQVGQQAAAGPERLFIARGGVGPIALLRIGDVTHRLGASAGLDAVDSDGRMTIATGRAQPNMDIVISVNGQASSPVKTDQDGRWRLVLTGVGASGARIAVGSRSFDYPGRSAGEPGVLVRSGAGWTLNWSAGGAEAAQSVWLPEV